MLNEARRPHTATTDARRLLHNWPPQQWPTHRARDQAADTVVGAFPDGKSALNLAAARLRHIARTAWSNDT
jgi:hypothetical protein